MTNAMPRFAVLKNRAIIGYVSGVSHAQAMGRAVKRFGRCELMACGNVALDRNARADAQTCDKSYSHGRSPYATEGFEARRAALIAAHKANA